MPTILITGACGFCGVHLAWRLRQEGKAWVAGVGRRATRPRENSLDKYLRVDVTVQDQVKDCVRALRPDWVFHLAGSAGAPPDETYRTNFLGTLNLLEAVRAHAPEARVLLVGSAAEYGNVEESLLPVTEDYPCRPYDAHGISKYAATLAGLDYVRHHQLRIVIVRPFNVVGPGISSKYVVGAVLDRAKRAMQSEDKVIKVGNVDTKRDFVAIDDVVEAYVRLIKGEFWGSVFNICSGRPYSIRSVISMLLSYSPRPLQFEVDRAFVRAFDTPVMYGNYERAREAFGFEPVTSLEESLRAAWNYEMQDCAGVPKGSPVTEGSK